MVTSSQAICVADLGYGDAGKGTLIDFLTRRHHAHTVVRFNGGGQAAHNVVTPDGRHHTFAQFGSGLFVPGTRTHLSRFMLVDPLSMLSEERHLQSVGVVDAFERTSIDRHALIVTPYHQAANRLREVARGTDRHGSCGMGIGETMQDWLENGSAMLFAGDLPDLTTSRRKLAFVRASRRAALGEVWTITESMPEAQPYRRVFDDPDLITACSEVYQSFSQKITLTDDADWRKLLQQPGTILFEGAQGVLLDEWVGFHPYTTWSTTTFTNALTLLAEGEYAGLVKKLGVVRAYATRHGAGVFVTEDETLTKTLPEHHNAHNPWQQSFRKGYFDAVMTRYAVQAAQPDYLAITHLDHVPLIAEKRICNHYDGSALTGSLDPFFQYRGSTVNDICLPPLHDLKHQAQLTQHLQNCCPVYDVIDDGYADAIREAVGVDVAFTSYGLTADDKRASFSMKDI